MPTRLPETTFPRTTEFLAANSRMPWELTFSLCFAKMFPSSSTPSTVITIAPVTFMRPSLPAITVPSEYMTWMPYRDDSTALPVIRTLSLFSI